MKQVKLYFLLSALLCAFSCGDNNNGDPDKYYHYYFEGTYPDLTVGNELILVYNGDTLANKKVDVDTRGGIAKPQGILTFENVISGEAKTTLTVDLIEIINPENNNIERWVFEGVYSTISHAVKYSGFINPPLLVLDLKEE